MKHTCKIIAILFILALILPCVKAIADAPTPQFTVQLIYDDQPIPNAEIRLFKVAEFTEEYPISFIPPFTHFSLSTTWDELAQMMYNYTKIENIAPLTIITTNQKGIANFPNIEQGIYLVGIEDIIQDNIIYSALSFIISIPTWDNEMNEWVYEVTAYPKVGIIEITPEPTATPALTFTPTPTNLPDEPTPSLSPLPQTGLPWRPVFVWIIAGSIFVFTGVVGLIIWRKDEKNQ